MVALERKKFLLRWFYFLEVEGVRYPLPHTQTHSCIFYWETGLSQVRPASSSDTISRLNESLTLTLKIMGTQTQKPRFFIFHALVHTPGKATTRVLLVPRSQFANAQIFPADAATSTVTSQECRMYLLQHMPQVVPHFSIAK